MSQANSKHLSVVSRFFSVVVAALALLLATSAHAAAPGITGTGAAGTFNLNAGPGYNSQPDGELVYSWGYGCNTVNGATYAPAAFASLGFCPSMQMPGPTLIVTEGTSFTVTLTNSLPAPAGNTSILFPGAATVTTGGGVAGLLTQEAEHGGTVTYTVTYATAGTYSYYSGTQPDLQIEMGLFGAVVVRPTATNANCTATTALGREDFRLAASAYDNALTCYDREYLIQWSEMDPKIHSQALAQVTVLGACTPGAVGCSLNVITEPYHPNYF